MSFSIDGVLLGHAQDLEALTGCSVLVFPHGAVGGAEVRGGAPATRETDLLGCMNLVQEINAILLTGGSAFGLAAAEGVMKYLEEKGWGFDTGVACVPIVPAAAIFDLPVGNAARRPDAEMGYQACLNASDDLTPQGNLGAGTGATVGKVLGYGYAMKSGWGCSFFSSENGIKVAAFAVVNAFGDVIDEDGRIIAGSRAPQGGFLDTQTFLEESLGSFPGQGSLRNTTLGAIVTNAKLDKSEVNWVARIGHNGIARSLAPSHTKMDGDSIFAAATGAVEAPVNLVAVVGARLMAGAVRNAAIHAQGVGDIPAACDLKD